MSFKITIQSSHHEFSAEPGQTILDAALGAGIVLPYSCRDGACSTCKGKVVSGSYDAGHCPEQILPREDLDARSEEHTSELQSLMRISYAVFCLKKKKRH